MMRPSQLAPRTKELLLKHIDGPQLVRVSDKYRHIDALARMGLVRFSREIRPRRSMLTDKGHEFALALLAKQANELSGGQ